MTENEKLDLMKKFKELNVAEYTTKYGDYYGLMFAGAEIATKELQKENTELKAEIENDRDLPAIAYMQGAEKQKKKGEWHFIKDKLPPEPLVVGDRMFPKNYICAYLLNNEYNDYEIGDFLYYGNGEFNGENKNYPIYAWLDKPTVIPLPPKKTE